MFDLADDVDAITVDLWIPHKECIFVASLRHNLVHNRCSPVAILVTVPSILCHLQHWLPPFHANTPGYSLSRRRVMSWASPRDGVCVDVGPGIPKPSPVGIARQAVILWSSQKIKYIVPSSSVTITAGL